MNCFEHISSTF